MILNWVVQPKVSADGSGCATSQIRKRFAMDNGDQKVDGFSNKEIW